MNPIPGQYVRITKVEATHANKIVGLTEKQEKFVFYELTAERNVIRKLRQQIEQCASLPCVILRQANPHAQIALDTTGKFDNQRICNILVGQYYEQHIVKNKAEENYLQRMEQVASAYEQCSVLPIESEDKYVRFLCLRQQDETLSWVMPIMEDPLLGTLNTMHSFPIPMDPYFWNYTEKKEKFLTTRFPCPTESLYYPNLFKAKISLNLNGLEEQNKECTIYLHGFNSGRSMHVHLWNHVLGGFNNEDECGKWGKKMPTNEQAAQRRSQLNKLGCIETVHPNKNCRNRQCSSIFSEIHQEFFSDILPDYLNQVVTFFQQPSTEIYIGNITRGMQPVKFEMYCNNKKWVKKSKFYKLSTFMGVCFNWNADKPIFHLILRTFHYRKNHLPIDLENEGKISNVYQVQVNQ